jgi:L-asparaginase / beta-aspartyl-peptidase
MLKRSQNRAAPPLLLVHGGAGPAGKKPDVIQKKQRVISEVVTRIWPQLIDGQSAVDVVTDIVRQLEASRYFNAGYGAVMQSDGLVRLSASLMDGSKRKFSGVQLATHMVHPSQLAYVLQSRPESVIGLLGAQLLARELGLPPENPVCVDQIERWAASLESSEESLDRHGTVGAVVLDTENRLAAATSTGGNRINAPDRISDSATVAGNYATSRAAISCTGIGEQIVDDGLAVRLETRVCDGRSIIEASDKTYDEALGRSRSYGWIGIDRHGSWVMYWTTEMMACAAMSRELDEPVIG